MNENEIYSDSSRLNYGDGFSDDDAPIVMPPPTPYRGRMPMQNGGYYPQQGMTGRYPPYKKKRKGRFFLKFLLILFLVAILTILVYLILVLGRIHYTGETVDHSVAEANGIVLKENPDITNILVFGEDNHQEGERGRADSMILLSMDKNTRQLKQTSFMRDIYVTIPNNGENKLNAAYSIGGPKLAVETIEYNFGIRIDYYMTVDFESFTDIIDSVGGIDLELTYDEVAYINWQSHKNHQTDDEDELKKDTLSYNLNNEGYYTALVHLNGRQALWYARDRDSAGSDFDRTQRQRIVLNNVFSRLSQSNPFTMLGTIYAVSGHLSTNMDPIAVTGKGFELVTAFGYDKQEYRLPTSDNYYDAYFDHCGQSLVIADTELEKNRLYTFIYNAS